MENFQHIATIIAGICVVITVIEAAFKLTFNENIQHRIGSKKLFITGVVAWFGLTIVYSADKISNKVDIIEVSSNSYILIGFLIIISNYMFYKFSYERHMRYIKRLI